MNVVSCCAPKVTLQFSAYTSSELVRFSWNKYNVQPQTCFLRFLNHMVIDLDFRADSNCHTMLRTISQWHEQKSRIFRKPIDIIKFRIHRTQKSQVYRRITQSAKNPRHEQTVVVSYTFVRLKQNLRSENLLNATLRKCVFCWIRNL